MFGISIISLILIYLSPNNILCTCPALTERCSSCTSPTYSSNGTLITAPQCTSCISYNFTYTHVTLSTLNSTYGCVPCDYRCKSCVNEYNCSICDMQYLTNNSVCVACSLANCMTCTASSCLTCLSGYYLTSDNSTCISCTTYSNALTCAENTILSCQPTFYVSNGEICASCITNCLSCSNNISCLTCASGYFGTYCASCSSNCSNCASATICLACASGFYLNNSVCKRCNVTQCAFCFTNGSCSTCVTNYSLSNLVCVPINQSVAYCLYYSNITACSQCSTGFYLNSNVCLPCSILCATCNGPHFGNCFSCKSTHRLYNNICLPYINNGEAYQKYYTARNTPTFFNTDNTTLINICTDVVVTSKNVIYVNIILPQAYRIVFQWKIYLLQSTNSTYSYTFNNSLATSAVVFGVFAQQAILCDSANINFVDTNTSTQNMIAYANTLSFQPKTSILAISQLFYIATSCSGSQCVVCASAVNCTQCLNQTYYKQLGDCVTSCNSSYYSYPAQLQCYSTCPSGTYPYDVNQTCILCPMTCLVCISASNCTSCVSGSFLYNSSCGSACPSKYFANSNSSNCDICQYPCFSCSNSTVCLNCSVGFLYNSTCLNKCPTLYYSNFTTITCQLCTNNVTNCLDCISYSKCISCVDNYYLFSFSCLSSCPDGYYSDSTQCSLCDSTCLTCSNKSTNCTSCSSAFLYVNQCLNNCPVQFYSNLQTSTCQACATTCLTCSNSSTFCSSCSNANLYNNSCLINCPGGYYPSNNICNVCVYPCATCTNVSQCSSCQSGFYYNNSCLSQCPDGSFQNVTESICTICSSNCLTCKYNSSNCLSCNVSANLTLNFINYTCVTVCPLGLYNSYPSAASCQSCSQNCLTCFLLATNCTSCISSLLLFNFSCVSSCLQGYFLQNGSCVICNSTCSICSSAINCVLCAIGYYMNPLIVNSISCVQQCPAGFYNSTTVRQCLLCIEPCAQCTSSLNCVSCINNRLLYNSTCFVDCPLGTFANSTQCQICDLNCLSCENTSSTCIECNNNLYLYNYSCVSNCNYSGFYLDIGFESCLPCLYPCSSCINTSSVCLSCIDGYLYNFTCVKNCALGTYSNSTNKMCSSCLSPCVYCQSDSQCLTCLIGYFYQPQNMTCLSTCSNVSFSDDGICTKCLFPCYTCTSIVICTSCSSGTLINGSCNNQCSVGMYEAYDAATATDICENCSSQCSSCLQTSSFCLSCSNSSTFVFNGTCLQNCPSSYYSDSLTGLCISCSGICKNCISQYNCTSCFNQFLINFTCYQQCPVGYFGDNVEFVCRACQLPCLTCITMSLCSTCQSGKYLYENQCYSACPTQTYIQLTNSMCLACAFPCNSCTNSTITCKSCVYGYLLYENQCFEGPYCPQSLFLFEENQSCIEQSACSSSYYMQLVNKVCSSTCTLPFLKYSVNNTCLLACPVGYYIDVNYQCQLTNSSLSFLTAQALFYISRNRLYLRVKFSSEVTYQSNFADFSIAISFTEAILNNRLLLQTLNSSINLTITELTTTYVDYRIKYEQSLINSQSFIQLNYTFYLNILSSDNIPLQPTNLSISAPFYNYYDESQIGLGFIYIGQMITAITLVIGIGFLLQNKFCQLYYLIHIMQNIYLLYFLEISYPPNLAELLEGFSNSHLLFMPNMFRTYLQQYGHSIRTYSYQLDPNYLINCGSIFTFAFIVILMYVMARFLGRILKSYQYQIKHMDTILIYLNTFIKRFHWSYWSDLVFLIFTPFCFSVGVETNLSDVTLPTVPFGIFLSIIISAAIVAFVSLMYLRIRELYHKKVDHIKNITYNQDTVCLKSYTYPINPRSEPALFMTFILFSEKLVIGLSIGAAANHPLFCLCVLTLKSILLGSFVLYYKPYFHYNFNSVVTFSELTLAIVYILMSVLSFQETTFTSNQKWILGWVATTLIIINILSVFLYIGWKIVHGGYERKHLEAQAHESKTNSEVDTFSDNKRPPKRIRIKRIRASKLSFKQEAVSQQQQEPKQSTVKNQLITYQISDSDNDLNRKHNNTIESLPKMLVKYYKPQ